MTTPTEPQPFTVQQAPGIPQQQSFSQPLAPAAAPKRSWFRRHKILTGFGAVMLIGGIASAAGANGGKTGTTPSASSSSSSSSSSPSSSSTSTTPSSTSGTNTAPVQQPATQPVQQPVAPAAPTMTTSQREAVGTAKDYLNTSHFSRSGLIKQLGYEGYSVSDATYGADAQHANWNTQAAGTAQDYLNTSHFSHSGLLTQLEYEGYTPAQAAYGVKAVGL